jgi:hypothetical protein
MCCDGSSSGLSLRLAGGIFTSTGEPGLIAMRPDWIERWACWSIEAGCVPSMAVGLAPVGRVVIATDAIRRLLVARKI